MISFICRKITTFIPLPQYLFVMISAKYLLIVMIFRGKKCNFVSTTRS